MSTVTEALYPPPMSPAVVVKAWCRSIRYLLASDKLYVGHADVFESKDGVSRVLKHLKRWPTDVDICTWSLQTLAALSQREHFNNTVITQKPDMLDIVYDVLAAHTDSIRVQTSGAVLLSSLASVEGNKPTLKRGRGLPLLRAAKITHGKSPGNLPQLIDIVLARLM